ncbi:BURP domain-containing protein BNM2A-like [Solanum verrucosum]|uniref:BURP domain-containing protein BNM2A-like n=1 Tax=Solanum verrucosum TaxID=315347 RepID=UPI0020D01B82|nr:BURP domain-containing protein BNM2A-like [Solanum verrucosum]
MDVKLGFCVLVSLILLVAYGTGARKIVEGNSDDNHEQALKEIYGSEYTFDYYKSKQGVDDNHQQEISCLGDMFRSWYKQGNDEKEISDLGNIFRSSYKQGNDEKEISDLGNIFRSSYKQGNDEKEISDLGNIFRSSYRQGNDEKEISDLGNIFRSSYKQGNDENEISDLGNIFRSSYKQGNDEKEISNLGNIFRSSYKQGNDKHVKKHDSFFFLMDDLKIGKIVTLSFQTRRNLTYFPKKTVDSIPFSQVKSMENTLRICEDSPVKGEAKYCATSAEAMLHFVQEIMGENTQIKALTTITTHDISPLLRRYTILDTPQQITTPKMVACHLLSSPYAVFYCHHTIDNKIKVFKVSLGIINEANGDRLVEAMVVCHLDTSEWNPSHESFRSLGVLPGTSPICHFFTSSNDLVWIPKSVATTPLVAAL